MLFSYPRYVFIVFIKAVLEKDVGVDTVQTPWYYKYIERYET